MFFKTYILASYWLSIIVSFYINRITISIMFDCLLIFLHLFEICQIICFWNIYELQKFAEMYKSDKSLLIIWGYSSFYNIAISVVDIQELNYEFMSDVNSIRCSCKNIYFDESWHYNYCGLNLIVCVNRISGYW